MNLPLILWMFSLHMKHSMSSPLPLRWHFSCRSKGTAMNQRWGRRAFHWFQLTFMLLLFVYVPAECPPLLSETQPVSWSSPTNPRRCHAFVQERWSFSPVEEAWPGAPPWPPSAGSAAALDYAVKRPSEQCVWSTRYDYIISIYQSINLSTIRLYVCLAVCLAN